MDALTQETLDELMGHEGPLSVSIYMPTQRIAVQQKTREDSLRLRGLLEEAKARLLVIESRNSREIEAIVKRGEALLSDMDFWKHQGEGLAVFITPDSIKTLRLGIAFTPSISINHHFYVTPLLEYMGRKKDYHILAIAKDRVSFLDANESEAREVEVKSLPHDLNSALWYKDLEKELQNRASAGTAGSYHGEDVDDTSEPNTELHDYLLKIEAAVSAHLTGSRTPLVTVGLQPALGTFNKLTKYRYRVGEVERDPNRLSPQELQELTWPVIEGLENTPVKEAQNAFGNLSANDPGRVSTVPDEIIAAAHQGRVDTLLVGSPVPHDRVMAFHEEVPSEHGTDTPALDPRLEEAVRSAYGTGARILFIGESEMPGEAELAAVMRF